MSRSRASDPGSGLVDLITIYDSPADMPGYYCVRRRMAGVFPREMFLDPAAWGFKGLEVARAWIAQEFPLCSTYIPRSPGDDPCILESWI